MDSDAEMMARHGRMLAGLAERAYAVACEMADQALAAEAPVDKAALARAFHEVSRSVRQSLALELRLRREARRLAREEAEAADGALKRTGAERRERVRQALHSLVWREYEAADAMDAEDQLDLLLDQAQLDEAFATDPVAAVIERLREGLSQYLTQDGLHPLPPFPLDLPPPGAARQPPAWPSTA